jgi:tRNA A-37 threonylcarbamoyl transferase component Bud32
MTLDHLAAALSDRYRLERELGQGGMATVYLAEDLKHDRKVAVKVLRPELAAIIGAERFLSEIKTTANLQHPHILPLHDSGEADGFLFYVMPYVEGETVRDRISREKQLPVADAVRITTEVAAALDYAHRHGVIHRDIKPENILLHDGSALVADFGIALAASKAGGTRMTETGMSLGTPHYMSPEQAMGEREITGRSDVYALGCVLYEMLTGDPPFTGSTAQAIVARVVTESPRGLTAQRHTIPPHVEAAVLTALEKLPADRFESPRAFAEALEGKAGGRDEGRTVGRDEGRTGRRDDGTTVARRLVPAAVAFVTLAAVGLWGWLRPPPAAPTSRQRVELWKHSLGRFLAPGVERYSTQAAIAPDGSGIVFADSVGNTVLLFRKRRDESEPVPIAGTEGALSPFISPDGRWIGYVTMEGQLRKVPVEGGGSVTLASAANPGYPAAAWLDDGTVIFVGRDQRLHRVSADGGPSTVLKSDTTQLRSNIAMIQPLPGSRGILYTACPGNCAIESSVYVFDLAADSGRQLVENAAGAWYSPTGHLLYTDRAGGLYSAGFDPNRLRMTSGVVPVLEDVAPASFAISASGSVLYSTKSGGGSTPTELMWVARDGRAAPFDSTWRADFEYPALSPDGKALAVSVREGSTQLWIRRADGARQKLTTAGTVNWRPSWTPDGGSIAYLSNMRGSGNQDDYDIYQVPVDASAPPRLLLHHRFGLWEVEPSRDGAWLVTRSDEEGGISHIRARRLRGDTTLVPLVVEKDPSNTVALSPDGHWLAYESSRSGRTEIYVSPFPSMATTQVISREGGTEARWAHSGRELFFRSHGQLMAVSLTPGAALVAGTPRPLFSVAQYRSARNRQQYDVAPDGQHFLMIREPPDQGAGTVVYVENWFDEFRAKVGGK